MLLHAIFSYLFVRLISEELESANSFENGLEYGDIEESELFLGSPRRVTA